MGKLNKSTINTSECDETIFAQIGSRANQRRNFWLWFYFLLQIHFSPENWAFDSNLVRFVFSSSESVFLRIVIPPNHFSSHSLLYSFFACSQQLNSNAINVLLSKTNRDNGKISELNIIDWITTFGPIIGYPGDVDSLSLTTTWLDLMLNYHLFTIRLHLLAGENQ